MIRKSTILLVIVLFTIFLFTACAQQDEMLSEGNTMTPTVGLTEKVKPTNTTSPLPTNTSSPTPTSTPSPSPMELPTPAAHTIYDGTTVELAKAKVGDVVLFGSYEQDNITSNGAETIPWYVLDKDGDKLLLMSVYLLDHVPYQEDYEAIAWEGCTLRQWMNVEFYNRAFTKSEKKYIQTSYLENADNPYYGTTGGSNTEDKVFALSLEEAEQYFGVAEDYGFYWISASPTLSVAKVTEYAEASGVWVYGNGNGWWWLRSPGGTLEQAACVGYESGFVDVGGEKVGYPSQTARPALWLNLNPSTLGVDVSQDKAEPIEDSMPNENTCLFEYELKADGTIRITGIKDKTLSTVCVPETIEDLLVTEIGEYAFFKCSAITYIELPSSVTRIGDAAFACCSSLVDISLPSGVTYIGATAFAECSSMTDIELPDNLTSLENFLFHNCSNLNSVKIPFGITKMFSDNVFLGCEALVSVEIPSSVKAIHDHIFDSCENLQIIIVVKGSYAEVWAESHGYKVSYNYGR